MPSMSAKGPQAGISRPAGKVADVGKLAVLVSRKDRRIVEDAAVLQQVTHLREERGWRLAVNIGCLLDYAAFLAGFGSKAALTSSKLSITRLQITSKVSVRDR